MGWSQSELGKALRVTFQQIQKYERGSNRVSASTLYRIASALDVPVSFFFDDLPDGARLPPPHGTDELPLGRESLELLRNYYGVNEDVRRNVYDLLKALSRFTKAT